MTFPASFPSPSRFRRALGRMLAALAILGCTIQPGQAREITDMAGRQVEVPEHIQRIFAAQPYTHVLTYMVAPDLLIGHLSILRSADQRFLRAGTADLPMLGGSPGGGPALNLEEVLARKPDIVLLKGNPRSDVLGNAERYSKLGVPVVFVDLDQIDHYPAAITFLGQLLGREASAQAMAEHARAALSAVDRAVSGIPEAQRVRVYYAESADGLATECNDSFHADAIRRAGAQLVHACQLKSHMGMEKLSLEQIIAYNPDIIVSQDPQFAATVYDDPRWAGVKAIAEHQVWTVPRSPFNWIDRPPSIMRILGIQWLAHRLYPQAYAIDMRAEILRFHQLFLGVTPSEADLDAWLAVRESPPVTHALSDMTKH